MSYFCLFPSVSQSRCAAPRKRFASAQIASLSGGGAARGSPPCTLWYMDGQSIQRIDVIQTYGPSANKQGKRVDRRDFAGNDTNHFAETVVVGMLGLPPGDATRVEGRKVESPADSWSGVTPVRTFVPEPMLG